MEQRWASRLSTRLALLEKWKPCLAQRHSDRPAKRRLRQRRPPQAAPYQTQLLLSTSLCRLQQELFSNAALLSNDPRLAPCFDAAIGSLQATLVALDGILSVNVLTRESLSGALKQLRSQHLLDLVLSSVGSAKGPPTPPAENYVEASLGVQHISFPHVASDTNDNPNVGHRCWAEPPPEYSPPAHGGPNFQETVDSKDMAAAPVSPERQDCTESGDSIYGT